MLKGKVVGNVWATRQAHNLPKGAFLEIEISKGNRIIAFDPLGCAADEQVIVVTGSVAAAYFETNVLIDALVIASTDEQPG